MFMDSLPIEIYFHIFSFLDSIQDLANLEKTCRFFRDYIAQDEVLYRNSVKRDFQIEVKDPTIASWKELYRMCYCLNISGTWKFAAVYESVNSYQNPENIGQTFRYEMTILHDPSTRLVKGCGVSPPQITFTQPIEFFMAATLNRLNLSGQIKWKNYGESTIDCKVEIGPHGKLSLSGKWHNFGMERGYLNAHQISSVLPDDTAIKDLESRFSSLFNLARPLDETIFEN